jgi:hypothetical protein
MTREARAEIGDLLANHLDAMEADMHARALPYKQAAEYRRRVEMAQRYVRDHLDGEAAGDLLRILSGDE